MNKVLFIGFGVVIAIIGIFAVVVALQPNDFTIERSTTIEAPPAAAFAHVNDFHKWDAWSPWAKLDPKAKNTFEGKDSGEGAVFKWSGNDEVGEGSMTIVESKPYERIKIRLDFVKPMEDTSDVVFTFEPDTAGTKVTWDMSGKNNFVGKAMCMVLGMQEMMNEKFDEGLASLKKTVEAEQKAPAPTP
jgi:uncharacterized protein YndB with AHSA1/START domain